MLNRFLRKEVCINSTRVQKIYRYVILRTEECGLTDFRLLISYDTSILVYFLAYRLSLTNNGSVPCFSWPARLDTQSTSLVAFRNPLINISATSSWATQMTQVLS